MDRFDLNLRGLGGLGAPSSDLQDLARQYGANLTPEQMGQLRQFLGPGTLDPEQLAALGLDPGLAEIAAEQVSGVVPAEEAETFEPLPTAEEDTVEPLFQQGRPTQGYLPRFGEAEGTLNTNLKPFLFAPFVAFGPDFNYSQADIAVPPFYLDFDSLRFSALYTDNALLSEDDPQEDAILAVNLDFSLVVQLTKSFRLSAGATVAYLPLTHEFGFSTLGTADFRGGLVGQVEALYDIPLGNWDLQIFDRFTVQNINYAGSRDQGFTVFSQDSQQGQLVNRNLVAVDGHNVGVGQIGLAGLQNQRQERFEADGTQFRNEIGASLSRLLPGDNRLTFTGAHLESWFTGFSFGLPRNEDRLGVVLASERENTRFKPSLSHQFYRSNIRPEWDQVTTLAATGPVSETLQLSGSVGQFIPGQFADPSLLWQVDLRHNPRPGTLQRIYVRHGAAGPNLDLDQSIGWRLSQSLSSLTTFDFIVEQREFLDLDGDESGSDEFRMGGILSQQLAARLNGSFGVIYRTLDFQNAALGQNRVWTTRVRLDQQVSDTVSLGMTYQWERWRSLTVGRNYTENLVILTLIKQL